MQSKNSNPVGDRPPRERRTRLAKVGLVQYRLEGEGVGTLRKELSNIETEPEER